MSDTPSRTPTRDTPTKKACDLCRTRKVKCRILEDETTCEACQELGLSCTRDKPRRKRGPPSRHFQGQQATPIIQNKTVSASTPQPHSPPSSLGPRLHPTFNVLSPEQLDISAIQRVSSTRSVNSIVSTLASLDLVHSLLDDWFRFVHPLCPVLHRQQLLQRLQDHGTEDDPVFGALIVSTCAVTLSTLRRKTFENYPNVTVERCLRIIEDGNLLQAQPLSIDLCIAWYNIASAIIVDSGQGNYRSYRAIREAMTGVDWLLGHRGEEQSFQNRELLKRLYWLLYMWQVGSEIQGQPHHAFLPFNKNLDHLRPLDLTDRALYPSLVPRPETPNWPEDEIHFIPGLNSLIDVFLIWEQGKVDMTHKPPEETLQRAVDRIQTTLDDLPPQLRWRGGLTRYPRAVWGHEAQMVNILITALSLKSNFLQHLGSLLPGLTHHDIACDVLEILDHLPQAVFEANGYAVVHKIRDIGAAYLAELESSGAVEDSGAQEKVRLLLKTLENLDFRPPSDLTPGASAIDT